MMRYFSPIAISIFAIGLAGGAPCLAGPPADPVVLDDSSLINDPIVDPQICVQLSVTNLVGGSFATFQVAGGPPGELTAVLYSFSLGSFAGTTGLWCYDFGLNIPPPPTAAVVVMGPFNGSGIFVDTRFIPAAATGWTLNFQAAVRNTCPDACMSNIHTEVVG